MPQRSRYTGSGPSRSRSGQPVTGHTCGHTHAAHGIRAELELTAARRRRAACSPGERTGDMVTAGMRQTNTRDAGKPFGGSSSTEVHQTCIGGEGRRVTGEVHNAMGRSYRERGFGASVQPRRGLLIWGGGGLKEAAGRRRRCVFVSLLCSGCFAAATVFAVPCQSALDHFHEVVELVSGRTIALFLDYDGTLSPIVNDPDRAYMSDEMRRVVRRAADLFNTAIVSGRSRRKVTNFVQLQDLSYAGSHGMDIMVSTKHNASTSTGGSEIETVDEPCLFQPAARFLPLMAKVKRALEEAITEIKGATVEDNVFSISVHFRNVHEKFHLQVKKKVKSVLKKGKDFADLKLTTGKMVLEVRPDIKWNKGNAVVFLLDTLKLDNPDEVFPIYIGDDRTDEDAFEVLRDRGNGIGILVSEVNQETHAFYRLRSPDEVKEFLRLLISWKLGNRTHSVASARLAGANKPRLIFVREKS
ncbi:hypothetical protein EJB05_02785, partial [Eragrostis curvula]